MKISQQQQLQNCKVLLAEVEKQPEMNLATWRTETPCGAVFCIGGLCATMLYFQEQGISSWGDDAPAPTSAEHVTPHRVAEHFFGNSGLFDAYGGYFDLYVMQSSTYTGMRFNEGVFYNTSDGKRVSDKQLAVKRLEWLIVKHEKELAP